MFRMITFIGLFTSTLWAQSLQIMFVEGTATIQRNGKELPAKVGMTLQAGDHILTQVESQVQIRDAGKYAVVVFRKKVILRWPLHQMQKPICVLKKAIF